MAASSEFTTFHSLLKTTFHGIHHEKSYSDARVTQYRGVKFASILARWRRAQLFEAYKNHYDATKHGPAAIQFGLPVAIEEILNGLPEQQAKVTCISDQWQDEFECLNLVITTPRDANIDSKLPVVIYIPGGGNLAGANSSWFNDAGEVVGKSIKLRKPVIYVTLNYRLGILGFLASEQIKLDNNQAGDLGVGNYGIHDVHLGIEWVYRNIAPFGGDPDNITLSGESAGSIDTMFQIHAQLPARFRRAILQSGIAGNAVMGGPISIEEQNERTEVVMRATNTDSLESLRRLPVSAFAGVAHKATNWPSMPCNATIDNVLFDQQWYKRSERLNGAQVDILIGDLVHEASVLEVSGSFISRYQQTRSPALSVAEFLRVASKAIPEPSAERIFSAYDIQPFSTSDHAKERLWWIMNDMNFAYPIQSYAEMALTKGGTVYRYLFDERNPFRGSFKGQANHALDIAYIFGARSIFEGVEHPEEEASIQDMVQEKWISFAYKENVWKPLSQGGYFAFGPNGEVGEITIEEVEKRRRTEEWKSFATLNPSLCTIFIKACAEYLLTLL